MGREDGNRKVIERSVGMAPKAIPGVAGVISQTEGSIGYVGSEYAFAMKIQFAQMKNAAGKFITPNTESISAACQGRYASRHTHDDHQFRCPGCIPDQLFYLDSPVQGTSLCRQKPSTSNGNTKAFRLDVRFRSTNPNHESKLLPASRQSREKCQSITEISYL